MITNAIPNKDKVRNIKLGYRAQSIAMVPFPFPINLHLCPSYLPFPLMGNTPNRD